MIGEWRLKSDDGEGVISDFWFRRKEIDWRIGKRIKSESSEMIMTGGEWTKERDEEGFVEMGDDEIMEKEKE